MYRFRLEILIIKPKTLYLEGFFYNTEGASDKSVPALRINGTPVLCKRLKDSSDNSGTAMVRFSCKASLDRSQNTISFGTNTGGQWRPAKKVSAGNVFPIATRYKKAYYHKSGWTARLSRNSLTIRKENRFALLVTELSFLRSLLSCTQNHEGLFSVLLRMLYHICKPYFKRKQIWLISDRTEHADDNGEAFFLYMRREHPEIHSVFLLSKKSPDYNRLKKAGPVWNANKYLFQLYRLLATVIVSSQEEAIKPIAPARDLVFDIRKVFLQHGITLHDISDHYNRYHFNPDVFITATVTEYQSIISQNNYFYDKKQIRLTGFPRYDRLYNRAEHIIGIMPTWRRYLVSPGQNEPDQWSLKDRIEDSQYFQMYQQLLSDDVLLGAAKKHSYRFFFIPHPNMRSILDYMHLPDEIIVPDSRFSYREAFSVCSLLITDYSSTAFDFAYLRKPVLYYQADAEEFYSGKHSCDKGYFDYERDGFGEVFYSHSALREAIIENMRNGCVLQEKYLNRIDHTFRYSDQNNCERVYRAIKRMLKNEISREYQR